ncbi:MAG: hypothetical protein DWQ34_11945 [Planctomycetota bacterium]|nr:MAG: hypothetical protein DWQ34_11945 [Planctomycetota bacterium]REK26164.1 MAG: hypothetical protein DWQ41_10950 [Planctomycetota bacterium]REK33533.1 MAG: hypothetical protein DWQ45_15215 [Planctomycetota bacterium]
MRHFAPPELLRFNEMCSDRDPGVSPAILIRRSAMTHWRLHPALVRLLRFQGGGKLRRMSRGFATPRRAVLSLLATALALVWLSNAILSIIFREPYPEQTFRNWLPLVPLLYAIWHAVKTAWQRPEEPIEWTPSEREFAVGGPFRRRELVMYRVAVLLSATFLKATCAAMLLLPDLHIPWAGLLGIFLGLAFVDVFRLLIDIVVAQVSERTYTILRGLVLTAAASVTGAALMQAIQHSPGDATGAGPAAILAWVSRFFDGALNVCKSPIGEFLQTPFTVFARLVSADAVTASLLGWTAASVAMLVALIEVVVRVDSRFYEGLSAREILRYDEARNASAQSAECESVAATLPRIPKLGGAGPLFWRQFVGARENAGGLLLALTAPAVLSCLPLLQRYGPETTFAYVSAALAFYSLLLLPAGLKFDFRRDGERLGIFKMLPVRPFSVVAGQLATPVAIAVAFQALVLTVACLVRPVPVSYLLGAVLFLVPLNVLIYSVENTIFLLYPHRLNQEGLEVFLRTTLMFTAKSLLFAVSLVVVYVLSQVARDIAEWRFLQPILAGNHRAAFAAAMWVTVAIAAVVCTGLLTRVYDRHDPCLDRIA